MNKFKYAFSKLIYLLIYAGICVALIALILNISRFIRCLSYDTTTTYTYISIALVVLMSTLFIAIMVATLISSNYSFSQKYLIVKFGFIKTKYDLAKIVKIEKFVNKKLVVFFDDASFSVIVIQQENYGDFISSLLNYNSKIVFSEVMDENEKN